LPSSSIVGILVVVRLEMNFPNGEPSVGGVTGVGAAHRHPQVGEGELSGFSAASGWEDRQEANMERLRQKRADLYR
jgi:hypothetical protein